jgi:replication factor C small subunit
MINIELWVEKYRPTKLSDVILPDEAKYFLENCLENKSITHLLFYGPPGTGKTTVARILAKGINAEVLMLNASDERGVDTVREKIKQFLMYETSAKWQLVFLDEADYMTNTAQAVLRNMMEQFSEKGRFILSANYPDKIIEPIRSRIPTIQFKAVDSKEQYKLLKGILDNEKVKYNDEDVLKIIDDCNGDMRRAINEAQKMTVKNQLRYSSVIDLVDVPHLLKLAKNNDWFELRKSIEETEVDTSYVLDKLFDYVFENIGPDIAVKVLGDYFWRDGVAVQRKVNLFCAFYELSRHLV